MKFHSDSLPLPFATKINFPFFDIVYKNFEMPFPIYAAVRYYNLLTFLVFSSRKFFLFA